MTIYNYYEHKFKKEGKYKCECGYKFKRIATSCWTENPFNKRFLAGQIKELDDDSKMQMDKDLKVKNCPKCQRECGNLSSPSIQKETD